MNRQQGMQQGRDTGRPNPSPSAKLAIDVAFDLGTTQFTIATAVNGTPSIEVYKAYPGVYSGQNSPFPPTALLYTPERDLPITGHDLKELLKTLKEDQYEGHFSLWKLLFHNHQGDPLVKNMQKDMLRKLQKLGKNKYDLLRDWIRVQYGQLFLEGSEYPQHLKLKYGYSKLSSINLRIHVAVPPGRDVVEHEALTAAFAQGPISISQVYLESEPTAMFASWVCSPEIDHKWEVGKVYLVQDGGGGTCSWVVFRLSKINPPSFDQLYVSRSTVCGAETISEDFVQMARKKLQNLQSPVFDNSATLDKMRRDFEKKCKRLFGGYGQAREKRSYIDQKTGIVFTYDEIKQCFQPCLDKILEGTKKQLQQGTDVDFIMLGGGLFQSEYIVKELRTRFEKSEGPRVICVTGNKRHVAEGTLRTRLSDRKNPFITSRAAPRSIGYLTRLEVTPEVRQSEQYPHLWTEVDQDDKIVYYYVALWAVKKSEIMTQDHELQAESSYTYARSKGIAFDASDDDLEMLEKIITSDFHPGNRPHTALNRSDQLINKRGAPVADIEVLTILKWNPLDLGIHLEKLASQTTPGTRKQYRVLKYTILLRSIGVRTLFCIKAWSPQNGPMTNKNAIIWEVKDTDSLSTQDQISESLQKSFDLGSGLASNDQAPQVTEQPRQIVVQTPQRKNTYKSQANPRPTKLAQKPCFTCVSFRDIPCGREFPACKHCRDREMGHLCFYKPHVTSEMKQQVITALEQWGKRKYERMMERESDDEIEDDEDDTYLPQVAKRHRYI